MSGPQPSGLVDGPRGTPAPQNARLGACDEEGTTARKGLETLEVQLASIYHVKRTGCWQHLVQDIPVMPFSVGNLNQSGEGATQVQQRRPLHGALGGLKPRPRKHRPAEVNGGRVQSVNGAVESKAPRFVSVHRPRGGDHEVREVGRNAPVDGLLGVGERGTREAPREAPVIELPWPRTQAGFQVTPAFAIGQLCEAET